MIRIVFMQRKRVKVYCSGVAFKYENFTSSYGRLRQRIAPESVSHAYYDYLTIIPQARMGYESIAHEGERNNCFSKIQLVGKKNIKTKHLFASFYRQNITNMEVLFATSGL